MAAPPQTHDVSVMVAMSGLDYLTEIVEGRLPQPPIADTLGFHLESVADGEAVFLGTPSARVMNPIGSVHGGFFATLLDSCMSCAVHTLVPPGQVYTTLQFNVHIVRGLQADSGDVRAIGSVTHPGRRVATSQGRIEDASGRLIAHGTCSCLIFTPEPTGG